MAEHRRLLVGTSWRLDESLGKRFGTRLWSSGLANQTIMASIRKFERPAKFVVRGVRMVL